MRKGNFCKYKACGAITKHVSGYCYTHNKQWIAGYKYALRELSGCQPATTGAGPKMLVDVNTEMPGEPRRDNFSLSFEFDFRREGERIEGFRREDGVGLPVLPQLAGPGDGDKREKTKSLGCGISETN